VKPSETPYKSLVLSKTPEVFSPDLGIMMENSIAVCDKLTPRNLVLTDKLRGDFQLIDYTLLCGGLDEDAAAGLSMAKQSKRETKN
jgi:hypothetical protein